ncbi:MAG: dihydropteroate synthase [Candidatus Thermoplasmatota archaeon]|nr:dihydropteroate synthase [Candidatus Thermoplasmatota archaeon]MEC9137632.1 dihydropteroate synthase [Candidatus Thermoplasmatota archaeon]MED5302985.1 dihydropteroate synthase [Candidatus Thermoplasmatota archaeon]
MSVDLGGRGFLGASRVPALMGVVNTTPDSFFSGSRHSEVQDGIRRSIEMIEQGASIIDIGGESTRPGASMISLEEELSRVIPVIEGVLEVRPEAFISIDTSKPEVARRAINSGCKMVNDVTGAIDHEMVGLVASTGSWVCVMHMKGLPRTMQDDPQYENVVEEVRDFLSFRVSVLIEAGVAPNKILVDPGIGFGKNIQHNLELLKTGRGLIPHEGVGILWGVSRKKMFADLLGRMSAEERLAGTLGVAAAGYFSKIDVLRVHDVEAHSDLLRSLHSVHYGGMS